MSLILPLCFSAKKILQMVMVYLLPLWSALLVSRVTFWNIASQFLIDFPLYISERHGAFST